MRLLLMLIAFALRVGCLLFRLGVGVLCLMTAARMLVGASAGWLLV